jgi:CPA1 family monovalent cation:H+ antiporter
MNALLFMLIGFELLVVTFGLETFVAGAACIVIVLGARWLAVATPIALLRRLRGFSPHAVKILTWGGLRGGISVALALSLPSGPEKQVIVAITYVVVAFSIIVQGLSLGPVVKRLYRD